MYKCAVIENKAGVNTDDIETNSGICPKSDKTSGWSTTFPPEIPIPAERMWCREAKKICTFPFIYLAGTYHDPYMHTAGVARCGTNFTSFTPLVYDNVDELDLAIPCSGEYMKNISCIFSQV